MDFRHEWKHEISCADLFALRPRLTAVMQPDAHAVHGRYEIRSMYFDNLQDKALREKIDGVNSREKFRIRYYNADISLILLEKKSKMNGLCGKEKEKLTLEEVQGIASRRLDCRCGHEKNLASGAVFKAKDSRTSPQNHCELYERAVCVCGRKCTGDTGLSYPDRDAVHGFFESTVCYGARRGCTDHSGGQVGNLFARGNPGYVQIPGTHTSAFSKYAACRIYG